jgi:hypothetical protein
MAALGQRVYWRYDAQLIITASTSYENCFSHHFWRATPMPITTQCPQCGELLSVGDDLLGKQAKCSACGGLFTIADMGGQSTQPVPPSQPATPAVSAWPAPTDRPSRTLPLSADENFVDDDPARPGKEKGTSTLSGSSWQKVHTGLTLIVGAILIRILIVILFAFGSVFVGFGAGDAAVAMRQQGAPLPASMAAVAGGLILMVLGFFAAMLITAIVEIVGMVLCTESPDRDGAAGYAKASLKYCLISFALMFMAGALHTVGKAMNGYSLLPVRRGPGGQLIATAAPSNTKSGSILGMISLLLLLEAAFVLHMAQFGAFAFFLRTTAVGVEAISLSHNLETLFPFGGAALVSYPALVVGVFMMAGAALAGRPITGSDFTTVMEMVGIGLTELGIGRIVMIIGPIVMFIILGGLGFNFMICFLVSLFRVRSAVGRYLHR